MTPPSFFCIVCNKNKAVKQRYCKDCFKAVTIDMMHAIDGEQMEGTIEIQKYVWELYVQQYGDLKERFIK